MEKFNLVKPIGTCSSLYLFMIMILVWHYLTLLNDLNAECKELE